MVETIITKEDWKKLGNITEDEKKALIEDSNFPKIIADEYFRIFDLLKTGQTYGAVWQIKDAYEVSLKFSSIIALAYICSTKDIIEDKNKIINSFVDKPLSSGDWLSITKKLKKSVKNEEIEKLLVASVSLWDWGQKRNLNLLEASSLNLTQNLNEWTYKAFKDNYQDFSNWRNHVIGHGALAFDDSKEYYYDFCILLERLSGYIEIVKEYFKNMALKVDSNTNNQDIDTIKISIDNEEISLYPFVILKKANESVFLFDAYISNKKKYDILDYHYAIKESKYNDPEQKIIAELYNNTVEYLEKEKNSSEAEKNESIGASSHSEIQEILLNGLGTKYNTVGYLNIWLREALDDKDKGILLLAMESGMGKTSWCKTLDPIFTKDNISLFEDLKFDNRVVYINRFLCNSIDAVLSSVQQKMMQDENGKTEIFTVQLKGFDQGNNKLDKKINFLKTLNHYIENNSKIENENFLLIFDGLDELQYGDLLEWLPTEEMLKNNKHNIKILITVRLTENLDTQKVNIENSLNTKFDDKSFKLVNKEDKDNIDCLKAYIEQQEVSFEHCDKLIEKSNNKYLYLAGLIILLKKGMSVKSDELKTVFTKVLDLILSQYPNKYKNQIKDVLGLLLFFNRALNIKALSELMGEETPSVLLASFLVDLQPLLKIDFIDGEAFYSIAHEEIYNGIKNYGWYDEKRYSEMALNCILDCSRQDLKATLTKNGLNFRLSSYNNVMNIGFAGAIHSLIKLSEFDRDVINSINADKFNEIMKLIWFCNYVKNYYYLIIDAVKYGCDKELGLCFNDEFLYSSKLFYYNSELIYKTLNDISMKNLQPTESDEVLTINMCFIRIQLLFINDAPRYTQLDEIYKKEDLVFDLKLAGLIEEVVDKLREKYSVKVYNKQNNEAEVSYSKQGYLKPVAFFLELFDIPKNEKDVLYFSHLLVSLVAAIFLGRHAHRLLSAKHRKNNIEIKFDVIAKIIDLAEQRYVQSLKEIITIRDVVSNPVIIEIIDYLKHEKDSTLVPLLQGASKLVNKSLLKEAGLDDKKRKSILESYLHESKYYDIFKNSYSLFKRLKGYALHQNSEISIKDISDAKALHREILDKIKEEIDTEEKIVLINSCTSIWMLFAKKIVRDLNMDIPVTEECNECLAGLIISDYEMIKEHGLDEKHIIPFLTIALYYHSFCLCNKKQYDEAVDVFDSADNYYKMIIENNTKYFRFKDLIPAKIKSTRLIFDATEKFINKNNPDSVSEKVKEFHKKLSKEIALSYSNSQKQSSTKYTQKPPTQLPWAVLQHPVQKAKPVKKQPIRNKKIGRNDPCPCGSGKKYKKCCGRDS